MVSGREAILNQIRNLLNRTVEKGCSENEATSAALIVERLLLKHGLTIKDAESPEAVGTIESDVSERFGEPSDWIATLTAVIGKLYGTVPLVDRSGESRSYAWVGEEVDVMASDSVLTLMVFTARRNCVTAFLNQQAWLGRDAFDVKFGVFGLEIDRTSKTVESAEVIVPEKFSSAFFIGFASGIVARIEKRLESRETTNEAGLVRARIERSNLLALPEGETMGEYCVETPKPMRSAAYYEGLTASKKVSLTTDKALMVG